MKARIRVLSWSLVIAFGCAALIALMRLVAPDSPSSDVDELFRRQNENTLGIPRNTLAIDAAKRGECVLPQTLAHSTPPGLFPIMDTAGGEQLGVTSLDGLYGAGALWRITPDGSVRKIYDFTSSGNDHATAPPGLAADTQIAEILDGLMATATPAPTRGKYAAGFNPN